MSNKKGENSMEFEEIPKTSLSSLIASLTTSFATFQETKFLKWVPQGVCHS